MILRRYSMWFGTTIMFHPKEFQSYGHRFVPRINKKYANVTKCTRSSCGTLVLPIKTQLAKRQAHQAHGCGLVWLGPAQYVTIL